MKNTQLQQPLAEFKYVARGSEFQKTCEYFKNLIILKPVGACFHLVGKDRDYTFHIFCELVQVEISSTIFFTECFPSNEEKQHSKFLM